MIGRGMRKRGHPLLNRRFLVLLIVPLLTGCAVVATPSPSDTDPRAPNAAPGSDAQQTTDCRGADFVREVQDEWAANYMRAQRTYSLERVCLRGTVRGFNEYGTIYAALGDDASFSIPYTGRQESRNVKDYEEQEQIWEGNVRRKEAWMDWVLTLNVGDSIEAECTITGSFGPDDNDRKRPKGTPTFRDCEVVGGPNAE